MRNPAVDARAFAHMNTDTPTDDPLPQPLRPSPIDAKSPAASIAAALDAARSNQVASVANSLCRNAFPHNVHLSQPPDIRPLSLFALLNRRQITRRVDCRGS
jgi:hypothetical protein